VSENRTDEAFRAILANATDPMTVTAISRSMIADAVSDPCHQDPKFNTNAGRSCATASCPFKYEDGHTYESCPYGKEANDVDAEKD
jgi:hypothetical protein